MLIKIENGDFVNLDNVIRLSVEGSGSAFQVVASTVVANNNPVLRTGYASSADAYAAIDDMISTFAFRELA